MWKGTADTAPIELLSYGITLLMYVQIAVTSRSEWNVSATVMSTAVRSDTRVRWELLAGPGPCGRR